MLLAGMAAAIVLSFDRGVAAADETVALSPEAVDTDDYYTRRAKRILRTEKARAPKPHPLAAAYPDMDIVVCEAGCPDRAATVVFMRKQAVTTEQREAIMVPTSDTTLEAADAASPAGVACIGGCYGAPGDTARPPAARRVERMALPPRDRLSPVR